MPKQSEKEYREIIKLRNWEDNPRTISEEGFERLKNQIKELGEYKPLIITEDGVVLGGNMRLRAYRELGFKECWVSVVKADTEEQKLKYALSDNDQAGEYHKDDLANIIGNIPDINLSDYSVNLGKLTPIDDLLPQEIEEDEVPEEEEGEPVSKSGEVYQLGRHRVMCGDSTKIEDAEKLMDGKKADMVFTDPPYSVNYEKKQNEVLGNKAYNHIENDDLSIKDISEQIWRPVFKNLYDMAKDDCSFYMTMPQGGDQMMMMMMMMMMSENWQVKHELIWVKPSPVFSMGRLNYDYKHEPIIFGWKNKHNWYGGGKFTKSVWEISRESDKSHPTMKPVELVANTIQNSTKNGDIVIDYFLGSGSTLIACEQTNRICYGMEIDPKYVDVIRKRYAKFIGKEEQWQEITPRV